MEGYEETFFIPKCEASQVDGAIAQAVTQGRIWMTNGPASVLASRSQPGYSPRQPCRDRVLRK